MVKLSREVAQKMLVDVPADKRFWCADGKVLGNLAELGAALQSMSEEAFRHHANENKNDFSNWVKDVIGDEKLARDLSKSTSAAQAAKNVTARIGWLKDKV